MHFYQIDLFIRVYFIFYCRIYFNGIVQQFVCMGPQPVFRYRQRRHRRRRATAKEVFLLKGT